MGPIYFVRPKRQKYTPLGTIKRSLKREIKWEQEHQQGCRTISATREEVFFSQVQM